jgi:hypothetical protein
MKETRWVERRAATCAEACAALAVVAPCADIRNLLWLHVFGKHMQPQEVSYVIIPYIRDDSCSHH